MMTLFYARGSSSLAAHIALEEAGATFATVRVDEAAGEQRGPAYLAINPRGKVPALRLADGTVLVENVAIQAYVARTHPEARLLPAEPLAEARALSLMAFFASAVHPAYSHYFAPARFTGGAGGEAGVRAKGLETFWTHCREIDGLLAGRSWFLDHFTTVDCYGFVFHGWGLDAGLPMQELAHFSAFAARMRTRTAVQRVLAREAVPAG